MPIAFHRHQRFLSVANPLTSLRRMRRPLFHILLLASCISQLSCRREQVLGPPKAVAVAESGVLELRLMSFNLRYENPEDLATRSWRQRIIGSVRVIRQEKPDVIGVQEAKHGQVADLWASLPDYDFIGNARDDGKRAGEYCGIFFRRDRFEPDPDDAGTFWLSKTPEKPGSRSWGNEIPRITTWIRLTDRTTNRGFYIYNTHWDHRNQNSREHSALLLGRRIDARLNPDLPVILTGDFNAVENNVAVAYLTGKSAWLGSGNRQWKNSLLDTYQAVHRSAPDRSTLHFWRTSPLRGIKVDHILVSRGARVTEAAIRSHDEPPVSDHYPVTATVRFPPD